PSAVWIGAVLAAVGVFGSLGYAGPLYPFLVRLLPPVFGGIRAAARFAFVAQIGIGLLAAAGLQRLLERRIGPWRGPALAGAVALAAFDEHQTARLVAKPETPPPPVEMLLARIDTGGPILHLPLYDRSYDSRYLFGSLAHFKPVVNGSLSYVPRRHRELVA